MDLQQVHGDSLEPGKWVLATYGDTPPRIVYQCACGKVNALELGRRDRETGVMIKWVGDPDPTTGEKATEPDTIACERKTCKHTHELRFVESMAEEMDAHRAAKTIRDASERALAAGVSAKSITAVVTAANEAAAKEAPASA